MTITVPQIVITGPQEAIIRDNVANADTDLGERALALLTAPYKAATLNRAQAHLKAATEAGEANLPNYYNSDEVIAWHLAHADYKDETTRSNEARIVTIGHQLASLTAEKSRHTARLAQLTGDSNAAQRAAVVQTIEGIDAEISALTAEKNALEA